MKRFVALTVALTMLIGILAGCASSSPSSTGGEAEKSQSAGSEASGGGSDASDDESQEPLVLTVWRSATSDNCPDEDNPVYQKLLQYARDEANVELVFSPYDWGDNFTQKLTMYASQGDLPSGIWIFGNSANTVDLLDKMGAHGLLHSWSKYVYDTENYPTLLENAGEDFVKMATCKEDGELYCFPAETHKAYPHAPGGVSIRKDWMLEQGLDYPTNEEELYNLIKVFAENYQDDNGNPIAPVSFNRFAEFTFWLNSWLGTSMWYKDDAGSWNFGKWAKQEQLDAALTFLNRLWNEGLMDKESFTQTTEQYIAKGSSSAFGVTAFNYAGTYDVNTTLYNDSSADSNRYIVSVPPLSCYDGLAVDDVNSVEITSSPFNRIVVTKEGISDEDFERIAKVVDWIGGYDASLTLLMGFEGEEWELDDTGRKIRTESWTESVELNSNWQYKCGLCDFSSLNSHAGAMYDLLNAICVRKSDIDSVTNIKGHQIAVMDLMNVVANGEMETENGGLIEDAWQKMVIEAITAPSEAECHAVVAAWPDTMNGLGYQDIVKERMATCEELAGGSDY